MQRIDIQRVPHEQALALAHPRNWSNNLLGSPADTLPEYDILDVSGLPGTGMLDKGKLALVLRSLERHDTSGVEVAASFESGVFSTSDQRRAMYVGLDHELITTNVDNVIDESLFETVEPAESPRPDLGTVAVRLGDDVLHVRSYTIARVMPGLGILALGLRDKPGKRGGAGRTVFGLDLLPSDITIGEVRGSQEVLTKVNAVHLLLRKQ